MKLIEWINGKTKLNKTTFDEFQNNIKQAVVPTGGTIGQVLAKSSNTDNDVKWVNQTGGIKVVDNLTSTSITDALSAKQGKILNEKITNATAYSTKEINTGMKWIDNKVIYRKVISGYWSFKNRDTNIAHNISNLDLCIRADLFRIDSSHISWKFPYVSASGGLTGITKVTPENVIVTAYNDTWSNSNNGYIILEYTKTTD